VHASQVVAPGADPADYFGYPRRQYQRMRELEAFLRRAVHHDLDRCGLGLRLKYLSGGLSPSGRLGLGRVLPERALLPGASLSPVTARTPLRCAGGRVCAEDAGTF
jgi:hypothetical protein